MIISVDGISQTVHAADSVFRCAIGRNGVIAADAKREGDGATPIGRWRLRGVLLRPDRVPLPPLRLPWRWLRPHDGWSDDPRDPAYNQPVCHPHPFGAERLWRDDHAYDIIVVIDHNSQPVVPGQGSAVFWHLAQPDWQPTAGCIAMERSAMLDLLPRLDRRSILSVEG